MQPALRESAIFKIACFLLCLGSGTALTGCGGKSAPLDLSTIAFANISLSPQPSSIPAGSTVTFTATILGTTANPVWGLEDNTLANTGTIVPSASNSFSATFTAPTPPVYGDISADYASSVPQGSVVVQVAVPGSTNNAYPCTILICDGGTIQGFTFVITAPAISVGITPTTVNLALGGTVLLSEYCVGSTNNAVTWQVDGVTGGSNTYGTIAPAPTLAETGYMQYTAPAVMPATGPNVTVTIASQQDPTKTATAIITLH